MKIISTVLLLCMGWHGLLAQKPIPVVVHVMDVDPTGQHLVSPTEITNKVQNMIDFYANEVGLMFELAKIDPNGNPLPIAGVTYVNASGNNEYVNYGVAQYTEEGFYGFLNTMPIIGEGRGIAHEALMSLNNSRWPDDKYLNIYVVNKFNVGFCFHCEIVDGYSTFPEIYGEPKKQGIVISASSIKDPNSTTLIHEPGHFFGLLHPFETIGGETSNGCPVDIDCKNQGDKICDTDPISRSFVRRTGPNPCNNNTPYSDNTECNIMSYSDCRTKITQGQIALIKYNQTHDPLLRSISQLPPLPNTIAVGKALNKSNKQIRSVVSIDPNEKMGLTNNTAANYVNGVTSFNYNIYFENKNTATAPAQDVLILDTLDKSKFDLSTFQLSSFGYGGSTKAYIHAGLTEYFMVDTLHRPGKPNLLVKTDAKLDTAKGILTWHFLSLDPQTRELVADPLDGFLPPNIISPQGEGYISYSVAPKTSLMHGVVIKNKAAIYFDNNAPIVTNEFSNTIDKVKPVSSVVSVPTEVYDTPFPVQWNGTDNGAGIRSYDIFYKVNNGAYQLWQYDVSHLESNFIGQIDSTYSFFSIAKDYAGNIESAKTTAERVVTVKVYDSTTTTCNGAITKFNATPAGTGFTYQWQVNTGSGYTDIANSTVYSGVNTAELTLANPPTSYTNYQYRCKISNGTVTYYSSKHALKFVSTWLGAVGMAWETPANWSCGVVPDENTHVIVPAGIPHTPVVNANGACKSLTMNSASNLLIKNGVNLIITGKLNN